MKNLEYLCGVLRKIGRADAAQILEMRGMDEWHRVAHSGAAPSWLWEDHATTPARHDAAWMVDTSMSWVDTREGGDYWGQIKHRLDELCVG